MGYKSIEVRKLAGALGAEIFGADLRTDIDNETMDDIHQAFLDHQVIVLRGQTGLSPERQKAFARHFGSFNIHPYVKAMEGHPEVLEIIKEPEDKLNFGGGWHSDMSFLQEPALGSVLHAVEVPDWGGDTLFASQTAAYEALSDGMKAMLEPLRGVHSAAREYGAQGLSAQDRKSMQSDRAQGDVPEYEHPVVRTHPETGRKGLYVNPAFTMRFAGMTARESKPLLHFLFEHSREERFTCRLRWNAGDVAFWDNRCVWHYALNDYSGQRRHMRRVTINGDRPH